MIGEELKKLSQGTQPKTLEELFGNSKEQMLLERVTSAVNALLPQMKEGIVKELVPVITGEIQKQFSSVRIRDGRDGRDGKSPDVKEIAKLVVSMMPVPKDGKDGKDAPTIEEIIKKIPYRGGKGGGGSTIRVDNLSSQCNGVTRVFTTTYRIGAAHLLFYSSWPTLFLPITDYLVSGNTITLVSGIDAPAAGQSLAVVYESSD